MPRTAPQNSCSIVPSGVLNALLARDPATRRRCIALCGPPAQNTCTHDTHDNYIITGVLNALLARDPAARRRCIALRTYAVLPLADDCGILQWVNNLVPFKVGVQSRLHSFT